ncbi:MAG: TatD family hydrolase [Sedimenticola sp.]
MDNWEKLTEEEKEVERATSEERLVPARSLAGDLGSAAQSYLERFIEIALGQYQLAIESGAGRWLQDFRRACRLYLPTDIIERRFPMVHAPPAAERTCPIFAIPKKGQPRSGPSNSLLRSDRPSNRAQVKDHRSQPRSGPSNLLLRPERPSNRSPGRFHEGTRSSYVDLRDRLNRNIREEGARPKVLEFHNRGYRPHEVTQQKPDTGSRSRSRERLYRGSTNRGEADEAHLQGKDLRAMLPKRRAHDSPLQDPPQAKSFKSTCPIEDCVLNGEQPREHVYKKHVPRLFHRLKPREMKGSQAHRRRAQMLRDIAQALEHRSDPHQLLELANRDFQMPEGLKINTQLHEEMEALCRITKWRIPSRGFRLYPLNSPAIFLHWRAISFLMSRLSQAQRTDLQERYEEIGQSRRNERRREARQTGGSAHKIHESRPSCTRSSTQGTSEKRRNEETDPVREEGAVGGIKVWVSTVGGQELPTASMNAFQQQREQTLRLVVSPMQQTPADSDSALPSIEVESPIRISQNQSPQQNLLSTPLLDYTGTPSSGDSPMVFSLDPSPTKSEEERLLVSDVTTIGKEPGDTTVPQSFPGEGSVPTVEQPGPDTTVPQSFGEALPGEGSVPTVEQPGPSSGPTDVAVQRCSEPVDRARSTTSQSGAPRGEPFTQNIPTGDPPKKMTFAEAVRSRPKRGPPPREPRATIGGEPSLEAFESHFHLDRLSWALGQTWSETMRNLNRPTDVAVRQPVQLVGGVMVFCDPEEFHKLPFLDNHFVSAVGIHPKKAHLCTQGRLDQLKLILDSRPVRALGEIGLDRSCPQESWAKQEQVLDEVLRLCNPQLLLLLHIRETKGDTHGRDVSRRCLEIVQRRCPRDQRVHLHCFTGGTKQLQEWMTAFPNSFFGFTGLVAKFSKGQKEALRRVPADRLLLETDAPHLSMLPGLRHNSPAYIGEVARLVSGIRREPLATTLKTTVANGRRAYRMYVC